MSFQRVVFYSGIAVALTLGSGCEKAEKKSAAAEKVLNVRFYTLSKNVTERYRVFPGIIQAEEQVNLSFRTDGQLIYFNAGPGKAVKKGTLLARLDPIALQATLDSAEAKYREALKDYKRYKLLYDKNVIAAAEFEKKKRDFDISEAAVRNAKDDLVNSEIYAPFSGIIASTNADTYQHIKAKDPLIRLQNLSSFQVSIDVPEKYFTEISSTSIPEVNQLADRFGGFYGMLPTLPGKRFKLSLKEASTEADPVTQTFRVTFRIAKQDFIKLYPGMTMSVFLPDLQFCSESGRRHDLFDVPFSAIFTKDGRSYVWLIPKDTGKVRAVEVVLGSAYGAKVAVCSEQLKKGDSIAASGVMVLHNGVTVRELPEIGNRKTVAD